MTFSASGSSNSKSSSYRSSVISNSRVQSPKLVCVQLDYWIHRGLELLKRINDLGFLKRRDTNDLTPAEMLIVNDLSSFFLSNSRHYLTQFDDPTAWWRMHNEVREINTFSSDTVITGETGEVVWFKKRCVPVEVDEELYRYVCEKYPLKKWIKWESDVVPHMSTFFKSQYPHIVFTVQNTMGRYRTVNKSQEELRNAEVATQVREQANLNGHDIQSDQSESEASLVDSEASDSA